MNIRKLMFWALASSVAVGLACAQDAAKVDPNHYKVEVDNAEMRILRVHYGAHEKSVMHSHPDGAVVYLTDGNMNFHLPGGKTQELTGKAGEAHYTPATTHLPENTGDQGFDAIVIELKHLKGSKSAKK
ncbi:MAG TPA: cupin domain-containing protein, partial [Terriglobales bacterium]|jgi:quercetin dioxygenase-like cupin family protein